MAGSLVETELADMGGEDLGVTLLGQLSADEIL